MMPTTPSLPPTPTVHALSAPAPHYVAIDKRNDVNDVATGTRAPDASNEIAA